MDSVSVIMPALNEEKGLPPTLKMMAGLFEGKEIEYEIILIDDGSTDATSAITEEAALNNRHIRVIHHGRPMGLGYSYKEGVQSAGMEYAIMLPANNECAKESIEKILSARGQADIIIPYIENMHDRPWLRKTLSIGYVKILNAVTGLRLKYYNGTVLHRTELIRSVDIGTDSYAYQAEALIKLIPQGYSFREIGIAVNFRRHKTKAFKMKNITGVSRFIFRALCLRLFQKTK